MSTRAFLRSYAAMKRALLCGAPQPPGNRLPVLAGVATILASTASVVIAIAATNP